MSSFAQHRRKSKHCGLQIVGLTSQCPLSSCLLWQRLGVPLSVRAAGEGVTCKLVLRLSGFLVFTFVDKRPS